MGEEKTEDGPGEGEETPKQRRRFSEKQVKRVIVVVIIVAVLAIVLWGMVPEKIYEVSEVLAGPAGFDGKELNVKGVVRDWNASAGTFTLADELDAAKTIQVAHSGAFPEGFGNGVTVVVKGVLRNTAAGPVLEAEAIEVGCPSKY